MSKEKLESLKNSSVGHSLIKAARLYNETMIERLRDSFGVPTIQLYHLNLFAHIDLEGSTINQIAKQAGISKQAVSKTVSDLIEMGLLTQSPNPKDARSKLIRFNMKGPHTIERGMEFLKSQDSLLAEILGIGRLDEFHKDLLLIIKYLDHAQ